MSEKFLEQNETNLEGFDGRCHFYALVATAAVKHKNHMCLNWDVLQKNIFQYLIEIVHLLDYFR